MREFKTNSNVAIGYDLFPFLVKDTVVVSNAGDIVADQELKDRLTSGLDGIAATNYATPLTISPVGQDNNDYTFPCDPILSISGKHVITRRKVSKSKMRGTIKERWSQDDYDVSIGGMLVAADAESLKTMVQALRTMLESGTRGFNVKCDLLNNYLDIQRLVVESWDFPPTAGVENQAFTIRAYSDDVYTLLEEIV